MAAGTVRDRAVTVAQAFCSDVYLVGQLWPKMKEISSVMDSHS